MYRENSNHAIKFTHGDLSPSNILVEDGHVTGIWIGRKLDGIVNIGNILRPCKGVQESGFGMKVRYQRVSDKNIKTTC